MLAESAPALTVDVRVVRDEFVLDVQAIVMLDGVTGLFGASGSGKSTLLRTIAGFEPAARGSVTLADHAWLDSSAGTHVPAHARPVGYVFQDARLFSHLDVAGNLAYAAQRGRGTGPQFDDVVGALDLQPLLQRDVHGLSGGEQQRVALGRSLLCNPRLLLLDEPLAGLDAARKNDIVPYLESLQARFALPTIYVSHQVDEIVRLADKVLVLDAGRVSAQGETVSVLNRLAPLSELNFEISSVLECYVTQLMPALQLVKLSVSGQPLYIPQRSQLAVGDRVLLRVRAGEVALATSEPRNISIRNVLRGKLKKIEALPQQAFAMADVDVDGSLLRCQLTRHAVNELQIEAGMPVFALLKTASFDAHD